MNLIIKTTLLYLIVAMIVFGIGGVVTYNMIVQEVKKETDYDLRYHFNQVVKALEEDTGAELLDEDRVSIEKVTHIRPQDTIRVYKDTMAPHPYRSRMDLQRMVVASREINGQYYRISVRDVFIESDDIYEGVVNIMTWLFVVLGVTLLVFSFLITRWLYQPFHRILHKIKSFNLKKDQVLELPDTSTKEFRQLGNFVQQMVTKARRDYDAVKEFSENASHEMQTPLAIARGKLELLMETKGLSPKQTQLIQSTQQSLGKLSKLGQALALLTKIDNEEFSAHQAIDFSEIVRTCIGNFEELASYKNLELQHRIEDGVQLKIDPILADVLIGNLVKNTIKHNESGGWIDVALNREKLLVRNTGKPPAVATENLFQRFQKSQHSNGSLGLGLAIVKKICEVNDFDVQYRFADGIHAVTVKFS